LIIDFKSAIKALGTSGRLKIFGMYLGKEYGIITAPHSGAFWPPLRLKFEF
jgi:hypothetical protein